MITLITGCMFAGKTSKAIRLSDDGHTLYFKPCIDKRYKADDVCTHDGVSRPAVVLKNITDCDNYFLRSKLSHNILIDEVQFFDDFIVQAIKEADRMGYEVYVTGLNYWADGRTPEIIKQLRKLDVNEIKLKARCDCGNQATFTAKMVGSLENIVEIGGKDLYKPMCKKCFKQFRNRQEG